MSVKIRLARGGRKRKPIYSIVVADSRSKRDGRFIDKLGIYNPNTNPATIKFDEEAAFQWVMKGAQPTDTVKAMLSYRGVMLRKHLQIGVIKGAMTQEEADKRYEDWKAEKDAKIAAKGDSVVKAAADAKAKALAEETKKKEAREEALRARLAEEEAAANPEAEAEVEGDVEASADAEATETSEENAETTEAAGEEAPAAEEKKEEEK